LIYVKVIERLLCCPLLRVLQREKRTTTRMTMGDTLSPRAVTTPAIGPSNIVARLAERSVRRSPVHRGRAFEMTSA
jgi:hypothetical protein